MRASGTPFLLPYILKIEVFPIPQFRLINKYTNSSSRKERCFKINPFRLLQRGLTVFLLSILISFEKKEREHALKKRFRRMEAKSRIVPWPFTQFMIHLAHWCLCLFPSLRFRFLFFLLQLHLRLHLNRAMLGTLTPSCH